MHMTSAMLHSLEGSSRLCANQLSMQPQSYPLQTLFQICMHSLAGFITITSLYTLCLEHNAVLLLKYSSSVLYFTSTFVANSSSKTTTIYLLKSLEKYNFLQIKTISNISIVSSTIFLLHSTLITFYCIYLCIYQGIYSISKAK